MGLTAAEKAAGRLFRDAAQAALTKSHEDEPPTYVVPPVIGIFRHLCPQRMYRSTALELKEVYLLSPIYEEHEVPAGRFGYIYRAGKCRGCGETARSKEGRLVDGWERPPISGRVARR